MYKKKHRGSWNKNTSLRRNKVAETEALFVVSMFVIVLRRRRRQGINNPLKRVKDILTLKNHLLGKQARFDSCFCLADFKLCSGTISHHAYSLLCAILESTNDLSYRTIGWLRTSPENLSLAIFFTRREIWNRVILAFWLAEFLCLCLFHISSH